MGLRVFGASVLVMVLAACSHSDNIDRRALVERNNPVVTRPDTLSSLTVGNGGFAMTVDVTGLQTYAEEYSKGVPLGTMSDWGWHSFVNKDSFEIEETYRQHVLGHGHLETYARQPYGGGRPHAASEWFRANPHRLHLGVVGLDLKGAKLEDLYDVEQRLDMYSGVVESSFKTGGVTYHVKTFCHPDEDLIATEVRDHAFTPVVIRFPYPTGKHSDDGCRWDDVEHHVSRVIAQDGHSAKILRKVDATTYYVSLQWENDAILTQTGENEFKLTPEDEVLRLTCFFSPVKPESPGETISGYDETLLASVGHWEKFWTEGAAVDFSHCTDARAKELERRVVLSQYLLAVNSAGRFLPQETGLTYNSWFGKSHLEMVYWHESWLPLWGHTDMLKRTLRWYHLAEIKAHKIAKRQNFKGVRWMKMTDPSGEESPSNVGNYLIWQQPHIIMLSELVFRSTADADYLFEMGGLVEETAEFMADFVSRRDSGHYCLEGFIPAQETLEAEETVNAPFELSYWHYALQVAQMWKARRGEAVNEEWSRVIDNLACLAVDDSTGLYAAAESVKDTYGNRRYTSDHPAVLGALGVLPLSHQVDTAVMHRTLKWVMENWNWEKTWGWDYPMVAMCATRLGDAETALDALLMDNRTNTFLPNGHNFQDKRLRCYLPGNGGLLTCVALMCAGWDGCDVDNPGFPKDGTWDVRWEGLKRLP